MVDDGSGQTKVSWRRQMKEWPTFNSRAHEFLCFWYKFYKSKKKTTKKHDIESIQFENRWHLQQTITWTRAMYFRCFIYFLNVNWRRGSLIHTRLKNCPLFGNKSGIIFQIYNTLFVFSYIIDRDSSSSSCCRN